MPGVRASSGHRLLHLVSLALDRGIPCGQRFVKHVKPLSTFGLAVLIRRGLPSPMIRGLEESSSLLSSLGTCLPTTAPSSAAGGRSLCGLGRGAAREDRLCDVEFANASQARSREERRFRYLVPSCKASQGASQTGHLCSYVD